jgi:integrase
MSTEYNAYLNLIYKRVEDYFIEFKASGRTPDEARFKIAMKKLVKSEVPLFFVLLLRFIDENNCNWSATTYKKMKTFYSQLKDFSSSTGDALLLGMVNQQFSEKLIEYYREKGLRDVSIKKNLDLLRWFMNWCHKKELIFNRDYEQIRFIPEKTEDVHRDYFLKWSELCNFYSFTDLAKKEEWCRDIFCFIAFTGIRFSQIGKIKKDSIKGRYVILGETANKRIFLNRFSEELCKKYENKYYRNNAFFPIVSLITFHKHLKSAALKAKLNRSIYVPASAEKTDFRFLHSLISAQTAINTYFANSVYLDIPERIGPSSNNSRSRIAMLSGSMKLAEEKQLSTSDRLYESIRSSGLSS